MRDIKFRGIRIDGDDMAYGYLVGVKESFNTINLPVNILTELFIVKIENLVRWKLGRHRIPID